MTLAKARIDKTMFITTLLVVLATTIPIVVFNDIAGAVITNLYDKITINVGWVYQYYALIALGFLLWLAFSRYGNIKLTATGESPEFSTLAWVTMIFSAGVGAGLVYWAAIEWSFYLKTPPLGMEVGSVKTKEWANTYPLFHWGVSAWAIYCLPAVAIAYPFYVRKAPFLRLSTGFLYFFNKSEIEHAGGNKGRFIDFFYMLSLIGGAGTSLGLATPMIAASMTELFAVDHNLMIRNIRNYSVYCSLWF